MYIKKGDTVKLLSGKDRGKPGSILRVLVNEDRAVVEGINVYKKRTRPKRQWQKGETVMVPRPIPAAKMMLVCKNCGKPTRVGYRMEGEIKARYCKKCQAAT